MGGVRPEGIMVRRYRYQVKKNDRIKNMGEKERRKEVEGEMEEVWRWE